MIRRWAAAFSFLLCVPLGALDLPPPLQQAVRLELSGRLSEALDAYRNALASEDSMIQDEGATKSPTIFALAHAGHLAIDLGYGEEASALAARLRQSTSAEAQDQGLLLEMRLLRLGGRAAQALDEFDKKYPGHSPAPSNALLAERALDADAAGHPRPTNRSTGPLDWWTRGQVEMIPSAADPLGLRVTSAVRLSVGVFHDWDNALTLIDMLREKGWSPLTDVKRTENQEPLYQISVLSRQPETDRQRLQQQGLLP